MERGWEEDEDIGGGMVVQDSLGVSAVCNEEKARNRR